MARSLIYTDLVALDRLLVPPREAARMLSISERTLWELSMRRKEIPFIRCGRLIRYAVEDLRHWIEEKKGDEAK